MPNRVNGELPPGLIRLACPFARCSLAHLKTARSCNGAGFLGIYRVKEHLKSVHPSRCPKCSFVFDNESAGNTHDTQNPKCLYRRNKNIEYMTEEQWLEVEKLPRRCRGTTPGTQWKSLYRKLFQVPPDGPVPAPYLPSLDQYCRISEHPSTELVGQMESTMHIIALSAGNMSLSEQVNSDIAKLCLQAVPALFDWVSETGLHVGSAVGANSPGQLGSATAMEGLERVNHVDEDYDDLCRWAGDYGDDP